MAISREKKEQIVNELVELFRQSKLCAVANYTGLSVAGAQELRRLAKEAQVEIKVVKNRLVKVALSRLDVYKATPTEMLKGQLLYAISSGDEVAPAKVLADLAKAGKPIELVAGIAADGSVLDKAQIEALAKLPSKEQLQAQLVGTIAAPLTNLAGVLSGNLRGLINVLNAKATN